MEKPIMTIGTLSGVESEHKAILDSDWMQRNAESSKNLVLRSLSMSSMASNPAVTASQGGVSVNTNQPALKEVTAETANVPGTVDVNKMTVVGGPTDNKASPRAPIQVNNEIANRLEMPMSARTHTASPLTSAQREPVTINTNLASQLNKIGAMGAMHALNKSNTITVGRTSITGSGSYVMLSRDLPTANTRRHGDTKMMVRRGYSDDICNMMKREGNRLIKTRSNNTPRGDPTPAEYGHVYLNVYDLEAVNKMVNVVAGTLGAGAYHAGVEIYGHEYNFGYTPAGSGVIQSYPRFHASHKYRKSIDLGKTKYSPREVLEIVERLKPLWPGTSYDILKRNCLNFADALCQELGVGAMPPWVMGLQNKINWTRESLQSGAAKLKQFDEAVGISRAIGSLSRRLTGECTRGKK
ncbi:PPPDE peptidase domain superfamily protein [Babesia gibsoni]|uniref:PPPDE peptidase domain superfamily protein n=1 Tax=Babesia gibsoni TaxID=33632 RepID=A0AAD8LQU0_BABGI|nr:PPPDE peptidase domain superfamily protein [Babesia gibsoni]